MNISGISNAGSTQGTERPHPFQALSSALKSGDLAGAQKAFADLQAKFQARKGGSNDNDADDKMSSLATALQSGDLAGAQQAFSQIQSKMGGHHHHHGQASSSNQSTTSATPTLGSSTVDMAA